MAAAVSVRVWLAAAVAWERSLRREYHFARLDPAGVDELVVSDGEFLVLRMFGRHSEALSFPCGSVLLPATPLPIGVARAVSWPVAARQPPAAERVHRLRLQPRRQPRPLPRVRPTAGASDLLLKLIVNDHGERN